ncbi:VWA containing CoxE-like protein [Paraglaciecola sp. T6c]|uniref:vWA domain-containing protein n=1 Tax=Pseudoalteromonas atlantica (strain T6c / ATCC BAA-1087) TaxID=3042615 RepID=UPI00005C7447|nr:VWA domain-containing protein [Paraglaciecola sp. T6c]ABG38635.1 VWA containing CoxE-like protein [Paraglaciecola sp. T6c]
MRFIADFIGALREAGLPISPAESLDAIKAIGLLGLGSRATAKSVLALTLVKRQQDQATYHELFELYFANIENEKDGDDGTLESPAATDKQQKQNRENAEAKGGSVATASSALGQFLAQQQDMALAIAQAAKAEDLSSIVFFTQKNHFAYKIMQRLGGDELSAELRATPDSPEQKRLQDQLTQARARLLEQVKDYVEQQYLIFARHKGAKFREDHLQQAKLSQLEHTDYALMQRLVQKAARKLATQHSRRRLTRKRGQLDVRKTIAANAAFDGALFHTRWKATRVERPKIMVICDVSGSVSRVARFLLLFLYSLQDVIPKVRSFVFASDMIEVTTLLQQEDIESALEKIMQRWGGLSTDYGKALAGFQDQALTSIDKKTTVILLGDARNNDGDGRTDIWQKVYRQSKRVLWLNPEQHNSWDTGDSIMSEYSPWCSSVEPCRNLKDIEGIFGRILKYS